ncbi:arsenate reductase/protein-tyrosine-phosphatase family protein [Martelella alba]|uniref:protein-tyrosine-phosphatase n=1 Tax=Martelella alba TaxID=2590451 RepID=A0ABY2SMZ4_9HYPH|nr:protein tyrosine phosphatase [Martelella alba]TKI05780.1 protein tyrosine phosphatase [Martelella alba]
MKQLKILVVCTGNICRSPLGEWLLKYYTHNNEIISAGIIALNNITADPYAIEIARRHNLDISGHHPQKITYELCNKCELILVMERKHINEICKIAPLTRGKILLFGHWSGKRNIPDPYRKSKETFEYIFKLLDEDAQNWARALTY